MSDEPSAKLTGPRHVLRAGADYGGPGAGYGAALKAVTMKDLRAMKLIKRLFSLSFLFLFLGAGTAGAVTYDGVQTVNLQPNVSRTTSYSASTTNFPWLSVINYGEADAYVKLGNGPATTADYAVPAGGCFVVAVGASVGVSAIAPAGYGTLRVAQADAQPGCAQAAYRLSQFVASTTTKTGPYSIAAGDYSVSCDAGSGSFAISLPPATGSGRELVVLKSDASANACTILPNGSDTIQGQASLNLVTQWTSYTLQDGGSGLWRTVQGLLGDGSNAAMPSSLSTLTRTNLGIGTFPPVAADFIPARHLSNLVGKTAATVCIAGDSTSTAGPTAGLTMDRDQIFWGFLQAELRAANPGITFTFANYGIGGANIGNVSPVQSDGSTLNTLASTGLTLPSWAGDGSNTWLNYVQTGAASGGSQCDALFWMFGTNASTSGQSAGHSTAWWFRQSLEYIDTWAKVPNMTLVTPKNGQYSHFDGGDDANQSAHKAQAAWLRTFARSDANGYTSFPKLQGLGFGLIDLGRYFTARIDKYDPVNQYLQAQPSCIAGGKTFVQGPAAGTDATTVCTTAYGDFRLSFTMPAAGGVALYNAFGSAPIHVGLGQWISSYLRINVGSGGGVNAWLIGDGSLSDPAIAGSTVPTTGGNDVTITVSAIGGHIVVLVTDGAGGTPTASLDVMAPRFIGDPPGGTPINVNTGGSTATSPPTFNVTEFWEGLGPRTGAVDGGYPAAYGNYGAGVTGCTVSTTGCQGGNSANHQTSLSASYDRAVLRAIDFRVPPQTTPRGALAGLACAVASNTTITIGAGQAADNGNVVPLNNGSTLTLNAATTGANGLDSGSLANATWYHVFLIAKTNGAVAAFGSTSLSPTLPTGYLYLRRVCSQLTDGSAHFRALVQSGDYFWWQDTAANKDVAITNAAASAASTTLASVPTGIQVDAILRFIASGATWMVTSPDQPDMAPTTTFTTGPGYSVGTTGSPTPLRVRTNTSAQIRTRPQATTNTLTGYTDGFIDTRGRLN